MIHRITGVWFFFCMAINVFFSNKPDSPHFIISGMIGMFFGVVWLMGIGRSPRSI